MHLRSSRVCILSHIARCFSCFYSGLILAFATGASCKAQAQTPSAPVTTSALPSYDVATIRPNTSDSGDTSVNTRSTTLQAINVPLRDLLQNAFGVRRSMIFGLPGWAESAHYDINAKVLNGDPAQMKDLSPEERRMMVRTLCEDRFALKWHYDTRVLPDYELVLAKGGAKFKQSASGGQHSGSSMQNEDLTVTAEPMSNLTEILSEVLKRPVVDQTGLSGNYDFHVKWSPDQAAGSADAGQSSDASPPLFTALQEQLGLKLQAGKDPIQVLVIDSIATPTEN